MWNKILNKIKTLLKDVNTINRNAVLGHSVSIKGSTIGEKVTVENNTIIRNSVLNGAVNLGSNNTVEEAIISGNCTTQEYCKLHKVALSGNITMGKYSSLWGPNLDIVSGNQKVSIGNFCSIARNVSFQTFNHNPKKITSYFIGQNLFKEKWENEKVSKGDIVLENDVWIGAHCVILGGVTIHNGAVVAANSVVTKDIPAYSIVAGTPAKVIGYRFDAETIQKIENLKWWNWSIEKIEQNRELFRSEIKENLQFINKNE